MAEKGRKHLPRASSRCPSPARDRHELGHQGVPSTKYLAPLQRWLVPLDGNHGVVRASADTWQKGLRIHEAPAGLGRYPGIWSTLYLSWSSGSGPMAFSASSREFCSSKVSEMYLGKISPRTTCLLSLAFMCCVARRPPARARLLEAEVRTTVACRLPGPWHEHLHHRMSITLQSRHLNASARQD